MGMLTENPELKVQVYERALELDPDNGHTYFRLAWARREEGNPQEAERLDPSTAGGPVSVPIASDSRIAKEKTARIAAELGLDPIDAGPLRYARNIEAMAQILMVPYMQGRDVVWDFYFPRNNYFICNTYEGDSTGDGGPAVYDADDLADIP